jgi:hypothetical protein
MDVKVCESVANHENICCYRAASEIDCLDVFNIRGRVGDESASISSQFVLSVVSFLISTANYTFLIYLHTSFIHRFLLIFSLFPTALLKSVRDIYVLNSLWNDSCNRWVLVLLTLHGRVLLPDSQLNLKVTVCEDGGWIELAQDRAQWRC